MASKLLRSIEKYAHYYPTSLSMQNFIEFGAPAGSGKGIEQGKKVACETTSVKFLKKEIPVRLANIMKELNHLPKPMLISPSIKLITKWYQQSFEDVIKFEDVNHDERDRQIEFTECLAKIARRHTNVVETMAEGVIEFRDSHKYDLGTHYQIQYFLDRFYMSRISIRMLINQHTMLFGEELPRTPTHIGCIDPHCNVLNVAKDSFESARFLCEQYYMTAPEVEYETVNLMNKNDDPITLVYMPAHLYHILFEIFKNAMRAVVEKYGDDCSRFPALQVLICRGCEDVMIRVSDRGGGIPRSQTDMLFNYMYSTAPRPSSQSGSTSAPLAGYGYGLPLSRLYARYFHGDLNVSTIDGYGTDALVTLKLLSSEANELLPIYNSTTTKQYSYSTPLADWSTPFSSRYSSRDPNSG